MSNIDRLVIRDNVLISCKGTHRHVVIPDGVTKIGKNAFCYSPHIVSVTIPDSVTDIGKCAFYRCKNLESVNFPYGYCRIGSGAFYNCESLSEVILPDELYEIGEWAFGKCKNLQKVNIPNSVKSIGNFAFRGCKALADKDGFIIIRDVLHDYCGEKEDVVIPDTVTDIGFGAFNNSKQIKSVSIPETVKHIGKWAFAGCNKLTGITVPESVSSIGYAAFCGCKSLEAVHLPDSDVSIGDMAFNNCRALADRNGLVVIRNVLYSCFINDRSFTVPDFVTHISAYAFQKSKELSTLKVPASVKYISSDAFADCDSIREFIIPGDIISFGGSVLEQLFDSLFETPLKLRMFVSFLKYAHDSVISDPNINRKIKANKKKIISQAMDMGEVGVIQRLLSMYKSISVDELDAYISIAKDHPDSRSFFIEYKKDHYSEEMLAKAENDKIDKELGLKEFTLTDWKKIYGFEFAGDGIAITSYKGEGGDVVIPERIGQHDVVAIDPGAFSPMAKRIRAENRERRRLITSVIIPDSVNRIGRAAFEGCTNMTSIRLPDRLKRIPVLMLAGCSRLMEVDIPKSVEIIERAAFYHCTNITQVTIPDGIVKIENHTFFGCENLIDVHLPDSVKSIGSAAFSWCDRLETINIPQSVGMIDDHTFIGCHNLKNRHVLARRFNKQARWL